MMRELREGEEAWCNRHVTIKRAAATFVAALAVAGIAGCFKLDSTNEELKAAQAEWRSSIGSLRARETEVGVQLQAAQERAAKDPSIWAATARRRLEASAVAARQGLLDLEDAVTRLGLEVKAASDRPAALEAARISMAGYLRVENENLTSTLNEIALVDRGEPKSEQAALANGDGR
jgi:hypothetical protein